MFLFNYEISEISSIFSYCFSVITISLMEPLSGLQFRILILCFSTSSYPLQILQYTEYCTIKYPSLIRKFLNCVATLRCVFVFTESFIGFARNNTLYPIYLYPIRFSLPDFVILPSTSTWHFSSKSKPFTPKLGIVYVLS